MNTIQLVGQVITCTNYTTQRLFNFNPEPIRLAAEAFLACGVSEIEIPQGVIDPEGRFKETTGLDEATLKETIAGLPAETKVVATYLGGGLGKDNAAYVARQKKVLDHLFTFFPDLMYSEIHPSGKDLDDESSIRAVVDAYAELAQHAAKQRPGFQLCFHNHYDSSGEEADPMRIYLSAIEEANLPSLRWGADTGHCHGMRDAYLEVFDQYAHLIGNYFHIKARVPAFDRLHDEGYVEERDIWSNKAEFGRGLYGGFVNVADPEITTPFDDIFRIIREKATPTDGLVRGALEIDIPRQHPRLEVLCGALYLKTVHGIEGAVSLSTDEMVKRVFLPAG